MGLALVQFENADHQGIMMTPPPRPTSPPKMPARIPIRKLMRETRENEEKFKDSND
jgi:hypothetical protein